MSARLLDGLFSEGFETLRILALHPDFSAALSAEIRKPKGVDRAMKVLHAEFFPAPASEAKTLAPPPIPLWEKVNETTIRVNLDAPLVLPFNGAEVEWPKERQQLGWVMVERKDNDLFVNDRKVTKFFAEGQKTGMVYGHELRSKLEGKPHFHPNIGDALMENLHLVPDSLKTDEEARTVYLFCWAVIFRGASGDLYVRCFYWDGGRLHRFYNFLDLGWGVQSPALLLAS